MNSVRSWGTTGMEISNSKSQLFCDYPRQHIENFLYWSAELHLSICHFWRQRSGGVVIISWFYHWALDDSSWYQQDVLGWLKKEKLDFKKISGIRFNNVASIAGVHGGIQHLLENINVKVKFMPISLHTIYAVFMHHLWMQVPYIFSCEWESLFIFSSSFHRYFLSSPVKVMMKRLVTTRWRARYEAVRAVKTGLQRVIPALGSLTSALENLQRERGCTHYFVFNWERFLHVTFVLHGRNSRTNKYHPNETSRTWYWVGCICNPHRYDQNFL